MVAPEFSRETMMLEFAGEVQCKSRQLSLLISVWGVCVLVPGCHWPDGPKGLKIDRSSPKSVVVSLQESLLKKDYAAIAGCIEPALRPECKRLSSSDKRYCEQGLELEGLLEKRFGRERVRHFRERLFDPYARMFSGMLLWNDPKGKTDPGRMTLRWEGPKTAHVVVDGEETPILATNVGGKWYVGYTKSRDFRGDAKVLRSMLDKLATRFERIGKGIRNGVIDKSNVADFLSVRKDPP